MTGYPPAGGYEGSALALPRFIRLGIPVKWKPASTKPAGSPSMPQQSSGRSSALPCLCCIFIIVIIFGGYSIYTVLFSVPLEPVAQKRKRGILRDVSIEPIPVTDEAIEKIPVVESSVLSREQCVALRDKHRELLRFVKDEKLGVEAIAYYDMGLNQIDRYLGEVGHVSVRRMDMPCVVMHNHPSGNGFTFDDVSTAFTNENVRAITAIGNDGSVYSLEKLSQFEFSKAYRKMREIVAEVPEFNEDPEAHLSAIERFLEGGKEYGVRYWKNLRES